MMMITWLMLMERVAMFDDDVNDCDGRDGSSNDNDDANLVDANGGDDDDYGDDDNNGCDT